MMKKKTSTTVTPKKKKCKQSDFENVNNLCVPKCKTGKTRDPFTMRCKEVSKELMKTLGESKMKAFIRKQ